MRLGIDGLASGLNTSEIIQQLMQIERRPVVLIEQRIQTYQQRMDAWRDVNLRLANLESRLGDLLLQSTFEGRSVTSSKAEVATATAQATAAEGTYEVTVVQLAKAQRVVGNQQESENEALGLQGSFTINGATVTVAAKMSLRDIVAAINEADAGVRASVVDRRLVIESEATGVKIHWCDPDDILKSAQLGILDEDGEVLEEVQEATLAKFSVNGIEIERERNTVNDVVEGVTFTLKAEGSTVIQVTLDTASAVQKVRAFVDQFNSAMDFIATRLEKGGILQGDAALQRLQMALRRSLSDRVETGGEYDQLAAVGLTFTREGRLELNEAKLREALESDANAVYRLFAGDPEKDGFSGVARRTRELVRTYTETGSIIDSRREMYEKQINEARKAIERFDARLEQREELLYRQFNALEQALAQLQTQSSWLNMQITQLSMNWIRPR